MAALLLLAIMIVFSPSNLCYDEPYHIDVAKSVSANGWKVALLSTDNQSAAGPLFATAHLSAIALTELQAPGVRWVNYLCLAIVIILISFACGNALSSPAWVSGLSILSAPFLWPSAGMALTELPALVAFSAYIWFITKMLENQPGDSGMRSLAWAVLAGVSFALAILGRQTYMITLPAVLILMVIAPHRKLHCFICLCLTVICSGWLFVWWGGLLPPSLAYAGGALRIEHGVLSLSYVAAATLFINPSWFYTKNVRAAALYMLIGIVLAALSRDYASPPAKTILLRLLGEPVGLAVGFAIGAALISASLLWLANTLVAAWRQRGDPLRVFLFLTLFALIAAPIKVSHLFSSRYIVGLLGVLIVVVSQASPSPRWFCFRMAVGSALGSLILFSYYY